MSDTDKGSAGYDIYIWTLQGWDRINHEKRPFATNRAALAWAHEYFPQADISIRRREEEVPAHD